VLRSIDEQDRLTIDLPHIKRDKLTASLKMMSYGGGGWRRGGGAMAHGRGVTSTT
jgi:hypothetical protein